MPIAAQYPGPFLEIAFEYTLEITLWIFGGLYYDKQYSRGTIYSKTCPLLFPRKQVIDQQSALPRTAANLQAGLPF